MEIAAEPRARKAATDRMVQAIADILSDCGPTIYQYGSSVRGDFRLGWSDIDLLVLTDKPMSEQQAHSLCGLRQTLLLEEPGNPYYRSFEGGMLSWEAFLQEKAGRVVYWGTSGERITDRYTLDCFGQAEWARYGVLLQGTDRPECRKPPSYAALRAGVQRHYETIRQHAQKTGRSFYSFGWLLDIARCLYTLRTGEIIPKTKAADWALEQGLCPDEEALRYARKVRLQPTAYREDPVVFDYAETLGGPVQRFADVLERALCHTEESAVLLDRTQQE